MAAFGGHWVEPRDYIYIVWSWMEILVNLEFAYIMCLCLLTNPFSQRMTRDLRYTTLFWLLISYVYRIPTRIASLFIHITHGEIAWSSTRMLQCTQFTSRDRIPGLKGCYLVWGTFLIGNLIPGPKNLVLRTVFS